MRKIISIMTALFILLISLVGCNEQAPAAVDDKSLTLNKTSVTLATFGEADIIASYQNIDQITWSNSNNQVISMIEHGNYVKVTALSAGASIVTVSGGGKTATCSFVVNDSDDVLSVEIDRLGGLELNVDGKLSLPARATYRGETLDDATLTYLSDNESVATVTADGVVTGVSVGETVIKVQAEKSGVKSAVKEVSVTVKDGPALVLSSTYFNLYEKNATANEKFYPNGKKFDFYMVDGDQKVLVSDYTIESTDSAIAEYKNGKVTALAAGQTTFTVTCEYQGKEYVAYLIVTVAKVPVVSIALNESKVTLYNNETNSVFPSTYALNANVFVDGKVAATEVTWTVDEGINAATVNSKGVVIAIGVGKAVISANYTYQGIDCKSTCQVEVVNRIHYSTLSADLNNDGANDINTNLLFVDLAQDSNVFTINNVDLTSSHASDLIRFGVPNYGTTSLIYRLFFRVTDVNNSNNWIEFIVGSYNNGAPGGILSYAMNASTWDLGDMIGMAERKTSSGTSLFPMAHAGSRSESNYNRPSGAYTDRTGLKFMLEHTQTDYTRNMVGFSIVDDEISFNYKNGANREQVLVFSKANQATFLASGTEYANPVFDGFSKNNVTKVNITVTVQIQSAGTICPLIIDTIGGNSASVSDLARMSIVEK